jgi:hypothetical protein
MIRFEATGRELQLVTNFQLKKSKTGDEEAKSAESPFCGVVFWCKNMQAQRLSKRNRPQRGGDEERSTRTIDEHHAMQARSH